LQTYQGQRRLQRRAAGALALLTSRQVPSHHGISTASSRVCALAQRAPAAARTSTQSRSLHANRLQSRSSSRAFERVERRDSQVDRVVVGRAHRECNGRSDRGEAARTGRACMYGRREAVGGLSPPTDAVYGLPGLYVPARASRMMAHVYGHHRSPPAAASRVRTGAAEAVGSRGAGGRTRTLVPGCHGYPGTCRKATNRTEARFLCETRVRNGQHPSAPRQQQARSDQRSPLYLSSGSLTRAQVTCMSCATHHRARHVARSLASSSFSLISHHHHAHHRHDRQNLNHHRHRHRHRRLARQSSARTHIYSTRKDAGPPRKPSRPIGTPTRMQATRIPVQCVAIDRSLPKLESYAAHMRASPRRGAVKSTAA